MTTIFEVSCKLRPLCHAYYVHDPISHSAQLESVLGTIPQ